MYLPYSCLTFQSFFTLSCSSSLPLNPLSPTNSLLFYSLHTLYPISLHSLAHSLSINFFSYHPTATILAGRQSPPFRAQGSPFSWASAWTNPAIPQPKDNQQIPQYIWLYRRNKAVNIRDHICKRSCFRVHTSFWNLLYSENLYIL